MPAHHLPLHFHLPSPAASLRTISNICSGQQLRPCQWSWLAQTKVLSPSPGSQLAALLPAGCFWVLEQGTLEVPFHRVLQRYGAHSANVGSPDLLPPTQGNSSLSFNFPRHCKPCNSHGARRAARSSACLQSWPKTRETVVCNCFHFAGFGENEETFCNKNNSNNSRLQIFQDFQCRFFGGRGLSPLCS